MISFLTRYGSLSVFVFMFLEQLGLPIPAAPVLLGAGALIFTGRLGWTIVLFMGTLGSLLGDGIWFELGRRRGAQVLGLLCRISMEPDTCARRTENTFARYGVNGLIVSKFLPGFNRLAPPMAGIFKVSRRRFVFFDGLGSLIYAGVFVLLGYIFHSQVDEILRYLGRLGKWSAVVIGAFLAAYILFKYLQRQLVIRQLRTARITPEELYEKIGKKEAVTIIDLRSTLELTVLPFLIPGAIHILPENIDERYTEIPRDHEIVVYCSCPNEATAARIAIKLHGKGITHIRPLLGGINGWRLKQYNLQPVS